MSHGRPRASTAGRSSKHRDRFLGRGICAGWSDNAFSSADDLRLPRKIGDEWVPYNPADWRPYASRQRWFRTPNDAFMTGNFHVSATIMQQALKLQSMSWFQLLLAISTRARSIRRPRARPPWPTPPLTRRARSGKVRASVRCSPAFIVRFSTSCGQSRYV